MNIRETHRALLGRLLPDENPDDLAVRHGQFHDVVIGSDRVVCFPRTRAAPARLPERAAALRALAGLDLGFGIPEPLSQGGAQSHGDVPFLVLTRIPGEPLDAHVLNDAQVADIVAAQYATLLAELARAGTDETIRASLPQAPQDRWQRFALSVRARLFELMSDSGRLRAERELAALDTLPHHTHAVVHGDLGTENVLWEWTHGRPHLAGVVDWDDVTLGDPAEDLAAIGAGHGRDLLERVLALGHWPNNGLTDRIAAIHGTFPLQQALYAIRDGDEDELATGLADYR